MDWQLEKAIYCVNMDYLNKKIEEDDNQYRSFVYDSSSRGTVCFHYLYDRCYKDDDCDFAHEIVHSKLQICKFDEKCSDYYCMFPHKDEEEAKQCDDFQRGIEFDRCNCRRRGPILRICPRYLAGFCPLGPKCTYAHPRYDVSIKRTQVQSMAVCPCVECNRFHLATPIGQQNYIREQWEYNSCNVLHRCVKRTQIQPEVFSPVYFTPTKQNFELAFEILKQISASIEEDKKKGLIEDNKYADEIH